VHSDQGFQYQHPSWRTLLADAGLEQSMSRRANWPGQLDRRELLQPPQRGTVQPRHLRHRGRVTAELDEYIDWNNTTRISTTLKGLSPVEYRAQALIA
jgi:putative transposase